MILKPLAWHFSQQYKSIKKGFIISSELENLSIRKAATVITDVINYVVSSFQFLPPFSLKSKKKKSLLARKVTQA